MSDPVPSFFLKLQRAEKHVAEAEAMIAAYVSSHPYEVGKGMEGEDGRSVRFLRFTEQPDNMLAVVIGDVIHNLRSALNHLAAACTPRENWDRVQFPIFERDPATIEELNWRKASLKAWNRQTSGMIPEAVAALQTLQPYYTGFDQKTWHGLSIVEELSNTDKHRELVITGSGLRNPMITKTVNGTALQPERAVGNVNDGAKITTETFPREVAMQIKGTVLVVVSLGEHGGHAELPSALHAVIRACRDSAIPTMTPFILPE